KLSFPQADIQLSGHAIELRIYAEDPFNNFLPDIGKLAQYKKPEGIGVRVDDGFEEGMTIPIYYDPMIAKLVTHGKDREEAISRMLRAIEDYTIVGVRNTLAFGKFVLTHSAFTSGKFDTHFVAKYFQPEILVAQNDDEAEAAAILAAHIFNTKGASTRNAVSKPTNTSKW